MSPNIGSIYHTFLCAHEKTAEDGTYETVFSVPLPRSDLSTTIKQRAVVQHRGDASGKGTWQCSKDLMAMSCPHIVQARHSLQQHMKCDVDAYDEGAGLGEILYQGTRHRYKPGHIINQLNKISWFEGRFRRMNLFLHSFVLPQSGQEYHPIRYVNRFLFLTSISPHL